MEEPTDHPTVRDFDPGVPLTLEHNLSATSVSISTDYSNYLIRNTPSIDIPKRTVELIRKQPLTRDSLLPLPCYDLGSYISDYIITPK